MKAPCGFVESCTVEQSVARSVVRRKARCYTTTTVIVSFRGMTPRLGRDVYLAPGAMIIGDVELGDEASVWFNAVVRGDVERIRIGARTNIQDNATIHVTHDKWPTVIGAGVTVAHGAVVHGCRIGDGSLVGNGAIVMDDVEIGPECLVAAGALVAPGTRFPPRSCVLGSPARVVRAVDAAEIERFRETARNYAGWAAEYRASGIEG
jgi:carbonic anhydrase/acetyltransferase-like protein (isoleucine patch superfamily)